MSETKIIAKLTRDQAFTQISLIRNEINVTAKSMMRLREMIIQFHEGAGWEALGYGSLAECFEKQLGTSFQAGYRQLKAALVERNILALLPEGEVPARIIPERHVRDTNIGKLKPESQAEAYRNATQMAKAEGFDEPTTAHVNRAVALEETKETVFQSEFPIVSHMVASGSVTAQVGRDMEQALKKLRPKQCAYIAQLMGEFGLCCPALFGPLASLFDRRPGKESKLMPQVMSGYLAGVPLKTATLSDWKRANLEAQQEHISESVAARVAAGGSDPVPVIVTLYKADVKRSLKAMYQEFGWVWMLEFFWLMCREAWSE